MLTTIKKWGNSHGVRLSLNILGEVDMDLNSAVEISTNGDCIIIKKAEPHKRRKNIVELFDGHEKTYKPTDIDWGEPIGKEVW